MLSVSYIFLFFSEASSLRHTTLLSA